MPAVRAGPFQQPAEPIFVCSLRCQYLRRRFECHDMHTLRRRQAVGSGQRRVSKLPCWRVRRGVCIRVHRLPCRLASHGKPVRLPPVRCRQAVQHWRLRVHHVRLGQIRRRDKTRKLHRMSRRAVPGRARPDTVQEVRGGHLWDVCRGHFPVHGVPSAELNGGPKGISFVWGLYVPARVFQFVGGDAA